MKLLNKFLMTLSATLLLLVASNTHATTYVGNNYAGGTPVPATCLACDQGQIEYRFGNSGLGANDTFRFDVQVRTTSGVDPFNLWANTITLNYNTVAFTASAFGAEGSGAACIPRSNPDTIGVSGEVSAITYSGPQILNSAADQVSITYTGTLNALEIATKPPRYVNVNSEWQTLFTVTCTIDNQNALAGFTFNSLTWDQTFRTVTGAGEDSQRYVVLAGNDLTSTPLFEAPVVIGSRTELWQDNRGVNLVFDRILTEQAPASFWVAQSTTATTTISAIRTTPTTVSIPNPRGPGNINVTNLGIEFARSADDITGAMLIVGEGGIASRSATDARQSYPSTTALISIAPSTSDLVINRFALSRRDGDNFRFQLAVNNFSSYSGMLTGGNNITLSAEADTPASLTIREVGTYASGIVVTATGVTRNTRSITVGFGNRNTCVGSACIRPILSSSISRIGPPTGTAPSSNFPDLFGPTAMYEITTRSSVNPQMSGGMNTGRLLYSGIGYTVTFSEDVASPVAGLVQRTRGGPGDPPNPPPVTSVVTGVSMPCTGGPRVYECTQSGDAVFDPAVTPASSAVAEYFLRFSSAADSAGNSAVPLEAPTNQRIATIRAIPVAIADSNDFWVVVDYGSTVSVTNEAQFANASVRVIMNPDNTITGASITTPATGLPAGVAIMGVNSANVIHFRLTPSGALDGGQSAQGIERFAFTLPANTVSSAGAGNSGDALEFGLPRGYPTANPEITVLWLESQDKSMTVTPGVSTDMDGTTAAITTFALGDIVYRMRLTEPLMLTPAQLTNFARSSISLHSITQEPRDANRGLMTGATYSDSSYLFVTSATGITNPSGSLYHITFSGVTLTRQGDDGMLPNGLVAVINPSAFGNSATGNIEDCRGTTWYMGSPTDDVRMTHCVSQNAAETPVGVNPSMTRADQANVDGGVTHIARSFLGLPFVERMRYFGWTIDSELNATAYLMYTNNTFSDRADLGVLESAMERTIHWQVQDNRGFYIETSMPPMQTIEIVRSVSFARSVTAIPNGASADVTLTVDADVTAETTIRIVGEGHSADTPREQNVAISANTGSQSASISAAQADTYRITTNSRVVYGDGSPLSDLTADGIVAIGSVSQNRAVVVSGAQPPRFVTYRQPAIQATGMHTVAVSVSGFGSADGSCLGMACGDFMATATSTGVIIRDVSIDNGAATMSVIIDPNGQSIGSVSRASVTLTGGSAMDAPRVTLVLDITVVGTGVSALSAASNDMDGDGIPDGVGTDQSPNALPVYYGGVLSGYIRATAGSRVRVSPVAIKQLATAMMLDEASFSANNLDGGRSGFLSSLPMEPTQAVLTFAIDDIGYEGNGISAGGQFEAASAGVIIPLPSVRAWTPRKRNASGQFVPVSGDGRKTGYGVFNSQGGSCPDDPNPEGVMNGPSSPYRDMSGNLRSNEAGNCMVLYIQDGSSFDADGQENGVIFDPVAMTTGAGGGGGGGSNGFLGLAISLTQFAGIAVLLLLASAYGMYRRRKQPQPVRIIVKK